MRWPLSAKITLGIAAILITAMSVSVILNVIFVRNQLMAESRHYAMHLSEVAEAGLENAMLIKDPEKIKSIMQSVGSRRDIVGAAIFNKRGEIKYSINPGDVGRTFSKNDPTCVICHDRTPTDQTQTVILPYEKGVRILKVVHPIINQPLCQVCHQGRVLGILMIDLSLAEVDQQAISVMGQQFRQSLAIVIIVIIALIGFMYLIVTRPLAHFVRITRAIDDGDLDKRVNLTHKDEIGELGASFDRMVESMAARTQELERLNEIAAKQITERKRMEEALMNSERRYRELSIVDDLTQLFNSRYFYIQLKIETERSNRYGQTLTLLMLDVDNFKSFNDAYGHIDGDHVLIRLGQVIKRCLRQTDSAYRYGGEEFIILLPMTTSLDGVVTAERIRTEFKKEVFSPMPDQVVHVTVSIGLAQYKAQEDMKAFVHRADQLMYQGKKNGKDRVCWS